MALPARLVHRVDVERGRQRLVRDIRVLVGERCAWPHVGAGPRVGVATFGSGCWHLGLEILLSHALALRGARPELLVCDLPDLPACDERTIFSRDRERCAGCLDDKRALLDAGGVPWRPVSGFVSAGALARARARAGALAPGDIDAHVERGWPIGRWLHVSASHYLRCDARGDGPEKVEARRRLLASAIVIVEAVERWLDEAKPDIVIAESGAHVMWRIALELARARGIPVVCRELGKGGWDTHIYALGADAMAPDLADAWAEARREPLSDTENAEVERYLDELPARAFVQRGGRGARDGWRGLGVPAGQRVAVLFTNVTWDLATAGRDVAFAGVFDWVRATIEALAGRPRAHLVVRAHPAEASVETRERILDGVRAGWPGGAPGVTLVEPEHAVAARELCEKADLVLAYNSTAGLEAAARGRRVVVCGNPHYRDRGFTVDVSERAEYARLLAGWADRGDAETPLNLPADWPQVARRWVHLFYFRYHVPMGWTTSPLEPPYRLRVRSLDELRPGANPALDEVCDAVLHGRQVLLPRRRREVMTT